MNVTEAEVQDYWDNYDGQLGACPECGRYTRTLSIWRTDYVCCEEHKNYWGFGTNNWFWQAECWDIWRENRHLLREFTNVDEDFDRPELEYTCSPEEGEMYRRMSVFTDHDKGCSCDTCSCIRAAFDCTCGIVGCAGVNDGKAYATFVLFEKPYAERTPEECARTGLKPYTEEDDTSDDDDPWGEENDTDDDDPWSDD